MFVDEHKASLAVEQAVDKIHGLSTAHCVVLATGIRHMQVTTDVLVMVQNQSNPVHMKPLQPTTSNDQHQTVPS